MPRKIKLKQKIHIVQLVRDNCCNYFQGDCLLLDDGKPHPCPQLYADSYVCKWFRNCVLPLDQGLSVRAGIKGDTALKRCCICGTLFRPGSNCAKYCAQCGKDERKRREAERKDNFHSLE